MVVGTVTLEFLISESRSLKTRRRVVNSLKDRIRGRFNVSVADLSAQDVWQRVVLGVAVVSNDGRFANEVLSKVVNLVAADPRVEIVEQRFEFR